MVENLPANAGDTGSSPGLGGSHMPWSNWAREPQLLSLRVWSLCSATREAAIVRGPRTMMKSGLHLPELEKALAQKRRPNIAINQSINKSLKKKKSGKSGHPCLVPDLRGNVFSFSPLRMMFAVAFLYMAFVMLRLASSMNTLWRVFVINGSSTEMIIWILFFSLLMWCIILIALHILKNTCIPGINPTLLGCMILSMCC